MKIDNLVKAFKHGLDCENTDANIGAAGYTGVLFHAKMAGIENRKGNYKNAMNCWRGAIFLMRAYNRTHKIKG